MESEPLKIVIRYPLTAHTVLTWETIYVNNNLYIEVKNGCLPDASKDAFVSLLEYAEDILRCQHAVIYFSKERSDRASLIRTFMMVGFLAVPPENKLVYAPSDKNVYMVYNID
ncbi:unnamed protein product [Orchesella dallaii]|uniref:Ornithine decarboxylase antizyme n=1 Tax=Orchesella dallaii TaxID=48710 RepID=A0ABP1RKP9_9HEXA